MDRMTAAPHTTVADDPVPVPRRIAFEFPDDLGVDWHPSEPEFAAMVGGASLAMPYLEPFLIRTVREALTQVNDEHIVAEGRAFNTQEQFHFQAHRRFNDLLKARRYPGLAEVERRMEADYARLAKAPLRTRMAYTAGFEAMTIGLTHWLIEQRVRLFAGADPRVASFIIWHMVEEIEHKRVAHDVYKAVFGSGLRSYFARVAGVFHGSLSVMFYSMRGYRVILRTDGRWTQLRSRLRLARWLWSFVCSVAPSLLRATLPGHDPRRERDPQWVLDWLAGHAGAEPGYVPLLDTADPQMPVPFAHPAPTRELTA